ncbi:MAG: S8 family peptidase [Acidobacteria bacterium]|nr:S8 family peptidase [Acidobacteriota bacterium]
MNSLRPYPVVHARASRRARRMSGVVAAALAIAALVAVMFPDVAVAADRFRKLDPGLNRRAEAPTRRTSPIVVRLEPGQALPARLQRYVRGSRLRLIDSYVLDVPETELASLDALPQVASAHEDRPAWAADYLSTRATGANIVQQALNLTGRGIGVAVIDSGVTSWHDDLVALDGRRYPYGNQRVTKFVDFVNGQAMPYDDHGHGSHVAGIILGNGYDSRGRHAGIAPDASLIALKALDSQGKGTISTIIAALDWVATNATKYNIRVVNLSAGAAVTQSFWIDPLALAARRLTERGIVVIAAAGNLGQNAAGQMQYGGILAPGNAPWVLTVGASSTEGTPRSEDDVVAGFSSVGPTRGDYLAKPDLIAPGRGILSLSVPGSTLYQNNASYLVQGTIRTGYPPYMSLSGTSMAAPQVAGAVALMLQANPSLTPNLVKAILQYTAHADADYSPLQQGAGFLDVDGAVKLARFYARNRAGSRMPVVDSWSQRIIWGNQLVTGGYINPAANAWATNIVWGTAVANPENIVWGTAESAENIVWGTLCDEQNCSNIVWGTADANGSNIVWGTADNIVWGTTTADNIVWGTSGPENIVWGTSGTSENIVWGTACGGENCANIVWGTTTADNIVWGTAGENANIVWGTADNIVWGTFGENGNIVWGTAGTTPENIVWGTADNGNIVWGTADSSNIVWGTADASNIVWGTADNIVWGTAGPENIVWGTADITNVVWPINQAGVTGGSL